MLCETSPRMVYVSDGILTQQVETLKRTSTCSLSKQCPYATAGRFIDEEEKELSTYDEQPEKSCFSEGSVSPASPGGSLYQ
jgi:hypothetical protein